jgi:hypothetical protein
MSDDDMASMYTNSNSEGGFSFMFSLLYSVVLYLLYAAGDNGRYKYNMNNFFSQFKLDILMSNLPHTPARKGPQMQSRYWCLNIYCFSCLL